MDEASAVTIDTSSSSDLESVLEFSIPWVRSFINGYFERKGKDPLKIDIEDLKVQKNSIQGILSTAFLVDVRYKDANPPLGMN